MISLRRRQQRAVELLRASLLGGHKRPILHAPTGFGKTRTAAYLIQSALDKGKRVGFTVPTITLVDQAVEDLSDLGITSVGVMQADHPLTDGSQPVQVISAATLERRKAPPADLVIVDEAHENHGAIYRWMTACPDVPFIGLTATPGTRGLGRHYDDLVSAATTQELIQEGLLSPFKAFAPYEPDMKGIQVNAGEYNQTQLGDLMDCQTIIGDIVQNWLDHGEFRPTIAFCVNRRHAFHIAEQFNEAGVSTEYVDAFTPRDERRRMLRRFKAGITKVITNVGVLTTGFDGDVRCLIDAHPCKSVMRFVQTMGRGLRTADGKDHCLIFDHAGNHIRHGMVTDIHFHTLDDGKSHKPRGSSQKAQDEQVLKPTVCSACKAVMPPGVTLCPSCGHLARKVTVKVREGKLAELGKDTKPTLSSEEKLQFYRELIGAKKPEWKFGWVTAKFKERYNHFPPVEWALNATLLTPTAETKRWLQSRQIAWIKAKKAA